MREAKNSEGEGASPDRIGLKLILVRKSKKMFPG